MNNEYIIINKTAIQKRIEELRQVCNKELGYASDKIYFELECLLLESTPLIPEIKKSLFNAFTDAPERGSTEYAKYVSDYISNLKLDI